MSPEVEIQKPVKSEVVVDEKVLEAFTKFMDKYCDLVWYARSPRSNSIRSIYNETPENVIQNILNIQARIEEKFVEETNALNCCEHADWQHGFDSGCLATIRYVMTAINIATYEEEGHWIDEDGNPCDDTGEVVEPGTRFYTMGGLKEAEEEFPMLDS